MLHDMDLIKYHSSQMVHSNVVMSTLEYFRSALQWEDVTQGRAPN